MDFTLQSGMWRTVERSVALNIGNPVVILQPNPLRWAFLVGGASAAFWITTQSKAVPANGGFQVGTQGTFLVRFADYAGAVQQQWYGQAAGAGVSISILEIIENVTGPDTTEGT